MYMALDLYSLSPYTRTPILTTFNYTKLSSNVNSNFMHLTLALLYMPFRQLDEFSWLQRTILLVQLGLKIKRAIRL